MIRIIAIRILSWFLAGVSAAALGSIFSTQRVIGALSDADAGTAFSQRASMTAYDLTHFGTLYAVFILLAFFIAFLAAGLVYKRAQFGRPLIYIVAGAVAIAVMLWAMEQVFFGVPIVAGARDLFGLLLQVFAGGLGGFIFARLSRKPAIKKAPEGAS